MEVKINKEIKDYNESIYFGLSLRQFIFSVIACGFAVFVYFLLKPFFGIETLSWLCILSASPFALLGFIKYNGMNAEQLLCAIIKSKCLIKKHLLFETNNFYTELIKQGGNNINEDELSFKR